MDGYGVNYNPVFWGVATASEGCRPRRSAYAQTTRFDLGPDPAMGGVGAHALRCITWDIWRWAPMQCVSSTRRAALPAGQGVGLRSVLTCVWRASTSS
jgi:hypothetical protein